MDEQDNKLDVFSPLFIFAFVAAFIGDVTFFLILTHYLCGIIVLAAIGGKIKGIPAKLILGVAFILPGPFLMIGILLAILLSNKILAFIAEQVAIQAIAIGTGGAGEALEVGALGAEAAEAGVALAEVGEAAAEVAAEGAELGEAAEQGAEAAEQAGESAQDKIGDKIKDKFKEKLQDKLQSGENPDQARQEIRDQEEDEQEADERYEELTTPEPEQDPIDVEVKKLSKVASINRPAEDSEPTPAAQQLENRHLAREQAKAQKAKDVQKQLEKPKQSEVVTKNDLPKAA